MALPALAAIDHLPTLEVGGHVYSNVTVTARTPTHLFIQHSRGFAGVKIDELSDAALADLGYRKAEKRPAKSLPSLSLPSLSVPLQMGELREFAPKFSQTDEHVSVE